ncbi:putative Zn-dependent peptidase [Scopulibacillus darangshiensis]|uniref:Putative Zn-dependent peptidase n=1 Tax=Scopulibacillus darangshiensis TaxID=442528 RepID=A0A4R2P5X6_9BACL|nr:pitrilysin family protein [Scopulibacillus darangshiensis]TCP30269.1 putative Zn-dependent peptidase [Scopulibacillus darangshiensis]
MEKQVFDQLQETAYHHKLKNGLQVYILPKKNFNKTFATFTTNYGSIDNHFIPLNQSDWKKVPDGIAHFLEHKMFEKPDGGDVFQDFGKQGASTNAFTSFTRTAYLFSSTSQVMENLSTLIDFVQTPAFTEESVEKEKGIIGQEIRMYSDTPDWRVYFGLIENMYHQHPIKIDIAGTIESISHITKELLLDCYKTFYHPSNMLLFIVGPVDPDDIVTLVEKNQSKKEYTDQQPIERQYPDEPKSVAKKESTVKMGVQTPKCLVGFKERDIHRSGSDLMKHELSVQLLLELMFGRGTENYKALIDEGLIDESFSFEYSEEYQFGFSAIGGNTEDPEKLSQRLKEIIDDYKTGILDEEAVERARKKRIGSMLRALNSPEYIANQFTRYKFNSMDLFDLIPTLEELTIEGLNQTLQEHFHDDAFTKCAVIKK